VTNDALPLNSYNIKNLKLILHVLKKILLNLAVEIKSLLDFPFYYIKKHKIIIININEIAFKKRIIRLDGVCFIETLWKLAYNS